MLDTFLFSLEIMLKGMAGIFTVTIIIALIVSLLIKLDHTDKEEK